MTNLKFRVDFLIKHIDLVLDDIGEKTLEEFEESDLLVRATCFSIVQIAEQMIRLEEFVGQQYPDLPWKESRKMRNLIVHVYNEVDGAQIYKTVKEDLPMLKNEFEKIRSDMFDKN